MRRVPTILLALLTILAVSAAQDSGAGWLKKNKKNNESRQEQKVHRFDRLPTMSFFSGAISRDFSGNWELDGRPLDFAPGCTVISADEAAEARVDSGSNVLLMGTRDGDTIVAWRVLVQPPDQPHSGQSVDNPSVVWSTSNPTVGEGGPAEF